MAYIRPIHQDDGWYASYSLRLLKKIHYSENLSFYSFFDVNGGNDNPAGFLFSLLQTPFFILFGINILSIKIFDSIVITLLLIFINLIIKKISPRFDGIFLLLFIVHPVFYYHFYNRPEILALLLVSISYYLILISEKKKHLIFFAFFIWAFIIDVHPIAIFVILGIGICYWYNNLNYSSIIILGGITGLFFYLLLNYFFNGAFGLFTPFINKAPVNFGDHYIPLFVSDLSDYFRIAYQRYLTLRSSIFFSLIWLTLPFLIYKKYFHNKFSFSIIFNTISFIILATFGTEASSNGFSLYSLFVFLFFYIIILENALYFFDYNEFLKVLLLGPFILYMANFTFKSILKNISYQKSFLNDYSNFSKCIPNNVKILMRPTFVFNTAEKNLQVDYTFGIMNVMAENKMSFSEAILLKKYDYILLDEKNLNEELLIDKRDSNLYNTPAYIKYKNIGLSSKSLDSLLNQGFLIPICEINEISHGKTILYKIQPIN